MTTRLCFESLSVRDFRNIARLELTPAPRLNVIAGDNGQGKTSLLEAIYHVATTRSFRTEKISELLRMGAEVSHVKARVSEDGQVREQVVAQQGRRRHVTLDGKKPQRLSLYATRAPVVCFHPGDLQLGSGPASVRRTMLDRIALFFDPSAADHRQRYTRALRERQRVLEERGPRASELDVYERLMAQHGARFAEARRRAAEELSLELEPAFGRMAAPDLELGIAFQPGGVEDEDTFGSELRERRGKDLQRRRATFGPQRDELELSIDGRSVRHHASQGQLRILTLALKVAELDCVRRARGAHPVLLLDDVSSELDPDRTGAVYAFLRETQCQVFVTTTRPELFTTPDVEPGERLDMTLRGGALVS